jgi:hypothetical protein
MRVLSSLKASPLGASHAASRALTWQASCLEWQKATRSSAYAESRVMPILVPDLLVRAVSGFPVSA